MPPQKSLLLLLLSLFLLSLLLPTTSLRPPRGRTFQTKYKHKHRNFITSFFNSTLFFLLDALHLSPSPPSSPQPSSSSSSPFLLSSSSLSQVAKIFLFQKNGGEDLAMWVAHHSAIVGRKNIVVVDDGSTSVATLRVLEMLKNNDVSVIGHEGPFNEKGTFLSKLMSKSKHSTTFLLPMDLDEYLVGPISPTGQVNTDPLVTHRHLLRIASNTPQRPSPHFSSISSAPVSSASASSASSSNFGRKRGKRGKRTGGEEVRKLTKWDVVKKEALEKEMEERTKGGEKGKEKEEEDKNKLFPTNISDPENQWAWNRRFKVAELFAYPNDCDEPLAQQHKKFLRRPRPPTTSEEGTTTPHSVKETTPHPPTTRLLLPSPPPPPPPPPSLLLRGFADVCSANKFRLAPIVPMSKTFYWAQTFIGTDQGNHFGRTTDKCGPGNPLKCFQDSGLAYMHFHTTRYPKWAQKVYSRAIQSYDMDVEASSACEGMHGSHYCKFVRGFINLQGKELFLDYVRLFCNHKEEDLLFIDGLQKRLCPAEKNEN